MDNTNSAPVSDSAPAQTEVAEQESQETQEQQPAAEAKPRNVKKLKLKVDGQEVEEEIDLDDEENLKRHLQMSKAAQKRMSEAAKSKREVEEVLKGIRSDFKSVLKNPDKYGLTPKEARQAVEDYLAEQLEEEMLSPEQRKVRDAERIIREREEEQKKAKADQEAKQMEELKERYAQDYDKKITEALNTSGLPKTPKTVKRMAELMHKNLNLGLDLEPSQLVSIVREDYLAEIKELFSAADGETLLKLLGDDTANKIRKSDLARLKSKGVNTRKVEQNEPVKPQQPQRKLTTEEWLAERRKAVLGK
jgi:hypothetical protein